ncbi:MAG TPA: hypothetical protein VF624_15640 [Tepidisphaeraceae bacterium]|jgi:hypothetical protein
MNVFQARIQISVFAVTIAILAGCRGGEDGPKLSANDHFRPDDEPRAVHNIFSAQAAVASREDGQLFAHHFTGTALNSLGRQKLGAIIGGREVPRIEIYMNVPKDGDYSGRQTAVMAFMDDRGIAREAFVVNDGANPKLGSPAAQGLNGLSKQSGGGDAAAAAPAAPAK